MPLSHDASRPDNLQTEPTGVQIVSWPDQRAHLLAARSRGKPCLVVVDDGAEPPATDDCCQDWMWRSGGEHELRLRVHHLSLRALRHGHQVATLDELGTLRVGLRTAHLPPKERVLLRVLLEQFGQRVSRERLAEAVWPDGVTGPNVVASRVSAVRGRVRWLGLEIAGSRDAGYCLRTSQAVVLDGRPGDEDDVVMS